MRAAVEFLQARGRTVSALAGHSKGGSGVICYAAKYQDIPKVVNIAGRYDAKTGDLAAVSLESRFCVKQNSAELFGNTIGAILQSYKCFWISGEMAE